MLKTIGGSTFLRLPQQNFILSDSGHPIQKSQKFLNSYPYNSPNGGLLSNYKDQSEKTSREIIVEQRTIIFALSIIVVGLVLLFSPSLPSEFKDLGISLIPAGILTAIAELYLRKGFMQEFRKAQYRYDFLAELERLGIRRIYESRRRDDVIFGTIARIAENEPQELKKLQILGMSLDPFVHIVGDCMDDLLRDACKFQFLSLDANSGIAKNREIRHETEGLSERIRSFDKWIKRYMKKNESKRNIELRKHSALPTFHITIINEERLFVTPYPIFGTGWDLPIVEIGKEGALFDKFKQQFEKAWVEAKPFLP